jgi:hypothetical protein
MQGAWMHGAGERQPGVSLRQQKCCAVHIEQAAWEWWFLAS